MTANTIFNSTSHNHTLIIGTVTFNESSFNSGPITGNVSFLNNSQNNSGGSITGDVTFSGTSKNINGPITGNITFNSSYSNSGTITGNAIFNSGANTGTISGSATFNNSTQNQGTVSGIATFNNSSRNVGSANGGAIFNTDSQNYGGFVRGDSYFYDNADNRGTISTGTANFYNFTTNYNNINTSVIFNDFSFNEGHIVGGATFNDTSYNNNDITGNVTFTENSYNAAPNGEIIGNADVYYPSANPITGTVTGTVTYHGYPDTTAPDAPVVNRPSENETIQSTTSTTEGACETGATVSISNAHLQTNPTTVVCSGGTFSTSITFLSSGLNTPIALSFTQTDVAGNVSSATVKNVAYALQTGSGGGGGGGSVIHEEKKEEKSEEKEQKAAAEEEKKEEKTVLKEDKQDGKDANKEEKTVVKRENEPTKVEILSEAPLYEPFATRERTLSIALKLSGIEITGLYICQNKFTDTPTPYSCEVAEKSQAAGLISSSRTTFRPERSVTRIEAYSIFMQSICVAPETNENNWKKLTVKKAIELGFTERTLDTFSYDRAISTNEMFALAKQIGEWKTSNPNSCQNK